jgi:biopolymer transport protein ExbD
MPRRSVTRFFIPLIDVLTVLFCIFLLMPFFRDDATHAPKGETPETSRDLAQENTALERELQRRTQELERLRTQYKPQIDRDKLRAELEHLRKEKIQALQDRMFMRVLEIDPQSGALSYPDPGSPDKQGLKIASAETAQALIRRHQQQAGGRELYYVFLFPRGDNLYPTRQQFEQYQRWFAGVASGVGNAE